MRMSKWFFPLLRSGGRNIPPMFTQSWALKTLCRTRGSLSCGLETLISPSHISYPQSLILDRRPIEIPASSFTTALHYLQCKCRFSSLTDIHNHYLIWEVTWQLGACVTWRGLPPGRGGRGEGSREQREQCVNIWYDGSIRQQGPVTWWHRVWPVTTGDRGTCTGWPSVWAAWQPSPS